MQRDYQKIPLLVNSFGSELNQVWTNIIDNAIDAMGGKGELRVRTYRDDDCVVVEISDNGPGISPEDPAPHLRTFLHDQGSGGRNRARPRHGATHCEKASGEYSGPFQAGRYALSGMAAVGGSRWLRERSVVAWMEKL